MPVKDKEVKKEYNKTAFMPRINISMLRNKENEALYENIKEAAQDRGITLAKYAILAIREKLERDGYI